MGVFTGNRQNLENKKKLKNRELLHAMFKTMKSMSWHAKLFCHPAY